MAIQAQSREASLANGVKGSSAYSELPIWPSPKSLQSKHFKGVDVESGYGTDTDRTEMYSSYPGSPMCSGWTPVNTPRATAIDGSRFPRSPQAITSSAWIRVSPSNSSKAGSPKRPIAYDEDSSEDSLTYSCSKQNPVPPKRKKLCLSTAPKVTAEMEAAYTLMLLHAADADMIGEDNEIRRRRASA